jgi:rhodanese-related sulfurtransferase
MITMKEISVSDAKDRLSQYRLIVVREDHEWNGELGHINGAELIPMGEIPAQLERLDQEEEILLICRSGNRSGRVGQYLASQGYKVTNLLGGMLDWNAMNLPVSRD